MKWSVNIGNIGIMKKNGKKMRTPNLSIERRKNKESSVGD